MKTTTIIPSLIPQTVIIAKKVAKYYDLQLEDLRKKGRKRELIRAKHISMHLAAKHTTYTHEAIAGYFGLDHANVSHANHSVSNQVETDKNYRKEVEQIEKLVLENFYGESSDPLNEVFQENDFYPNN